MCAGSRIVVEEFLDGEEASFFALLDGHTCLALASAQVCMSHQQSCLCSVCHASEMVDMISHYAPNTPASHLYVHHYLAGLLVVPLAQNTLLVRNLL